MSDLSQKAQTAYEVGSTATLDTTFNAILVIFIGLVFLLLGYIIVCLLKGIGDKSVKISNVPTYLIRGIILVLSLLTFFLYNNN